MNINRTLVPKVFFGNILIIIFLFLSNISFSQSQKIIIKLKPNTPVSILNNFKSGNIKSGNTSIARICRDFNISNSKEIFPNILKGLKKEEIASFNFDKIFIAEINSVNKSEALSFLSKNEFIEYAQSNNKYTLNNIIPNDPYYNSQYYLRTLNMEAVWSISQGDSTIIVGVVDSGLDILHPDLINSFKINFGEIPGNGIDDDGNGFIDDYYGWNFVSNNNDVTDDNNFSHGTAVTGIISAGFNNGIGISSVAPNCKVLVLKAFDSQGNGYDDNVATAILYGISRGVKIFNFSFGDYIFSNLLRDVIRYAYSKNIVMVSSAGNDASDVLHYPSAFDEVISVGASDADNNRASFSAFGETVDIFAPGYQILTTSRRGQGSIEFNNDYSYISGTSFSAPLVSGIAGLLLSVNKNLSNEEIRGILVSSTNYFPSQFNWNHDFSSGILNAFSSINNVNTPSIARIFFPYQDYSTTSDTIPFIISAASPLFHSYSIYYGIGENPANFIPIISNKYNQVLKDSVGFWNLSSLPDTTYTLRLVINSNSGRTIEHRMIIHKDKSSPFITNYFNTEITYKDNFAELITFLTNKNTTGKIYYKRKNISEPYNFIYADAGSNNVGYNTEEHFGLLKYSDLIPNTNYEFYIEALSLNGKNIILNDTSFHFFTKTQINLTGYNRKSYTLPLIQVCNTIFDINNNGKNDVFLNDIKNNLKLNVYEFSNNSFIKISNNNWQDYTIARDLTYLNTNKVALLTSTGRNGAVYQAPAAYGLPTDKIWSDELNDNFWASRFADVNNNGIKEILGFGTTGLRILEYNNNSFSEIANLLYARVNAQANSQNVLVEDFDSEGKNEIVFIDTYFPYQNSINQNTDVNIYRSVSGNTFQKIFTDTLYRFIKGDNLISGDFDGDGKKEFAVGTISNSSDLIQYYALFIYKANTNNSYNIINEIDIYNLDPGAEVSTKSANIDNDMKDEILINSGKNFYIYKFNNSTNSFDPVYYSSNVNSVNQLVFDFDNNGIKEIGLNFINDSLHFIEKDILFAGPLTPSDFKAYSIDSNKVNLSFTSVANAKYYKIYRADTDTLQNFIFYDSTVTTNYFDNNVINKKKYLYKITSVDTNLTTKESKPTDFISVYVHNKSKLAEAKYQNDGYISVKFSEKINFTIPAMNSFIVNNNIGYPKSIAVKNNYEYLVSFDKLINGNYSIKSNGLSDFYSSPADTNSIAFIVNQVDSLIFYIRNVSLADKYKLKVEFNLPVDTVSIKNISNYSFEPFGFQILSVEYNSLANNIIYLNLSNSGTIGASGKNYLLKVFNVFSSTGIKIVTGAGGSFGLLFNRENLNDVTVYPNPYSSKSKQNFITFANLTRTARIYIYDLTGRYIAYVEEKDGNGGVEWNLKTLDGKDVPTGIYIFRAEGFNSNNIPVEDKIGKFMIVK